MREKTLSCASLCAFLVCWLGFILSGCGSGSSTGGAGTDPEDDGSQSIQLNAASINPEFLIPGEDLAIDVEFQVSPDEDDADDDGDDGDDDDGDDDDGDDDDGDDDDGDDDDADDDDGVTFAIRVSVVIRNDAGETIALLAEEIPFQFPPDLPEGQPHTVTATLHWNGLADATGAPAPCGVFSYEVSGTLVRFETDDNEIEEELIGVSNTLTGTLLVCDGGILVTVPATSATSPAFIEGFCAPADGQPCSVVVTGPSGEVPVTLLAENRFFVDVPLNPATPNTVEFTHTATGAVVSGTMTWAVTELEDKNFSTDVVLIRRGDSLLFTVDGDDDDDGDDGDDGDDDDDDDDGDDGDDDDRVMIDTDGDGIADLTGAEGQRFPTLYDTAGDFIVTAWEFDDDGDNDDHDDEVVGTLRVIVVDVDLAPPVACQVSYRREKDVVVDLPEHVDKVHFVAGAPALFEVSVKETTPTGATLYLKPLSRGLIVLAARLGAENGPVIKAAEIDEFTLDVPAKSCTIINDDTDKGTSRITIRPYIDYLNFHFEMTATQSRFAGGATTLDALTLTDFATETDPEAGETIGVFLYDLEVPEDEPSYHFEIVVREGNVSGQGDQVGAEDVQGCAARVSVPIHGLVPTPAYERELLITLVTSCPAVVGSSPLDVRIRSDADPQPAALPLFTEPDPDSTIRVGVVDCTQPAGTEFAPIVTGGPAPLGFYDVVIGDTLFDNVLNVAAADRALGRVVDGVFIPAFEVTTIANAVPELIGAYAASQFAVTPKIIAPFDKAIRNSFTATYFAVDGNGQGLGPGIAVTFVRTGTTATGVIYMTTKPLVLVTNQALQGDYPEATVVHAVAGGELKVIVPVPR